MIKKDELNILKHLLIELKNSENVGITQSNLPESFKLNKTSDEIEMTFRHFANIFSEYIAGEYFDNGFGYVMIKPNSKTYSFDFEKEYENQLENEKIKSIEFEKSNIDLELAKKMLKEFPKTKWIARVSIVIAGGLALLELIRYIKGQ